MTSSVLFLDGARCDRDDVSRRECRDGDLSVLDNPRRAGYVTHLLAFWRSSSCRHASPLWRPRTRKWSKQPRCLVDCRTQPLFRDGRDTAHLRATQVAPPANFELHPRRAHFLGWLVRKRRYARTTTSPRPIPRVSRRI